MALRSSSATDCAAAGRLTARVIWEPALASARAVSKPIPAAPPGDDNPLAGQINAARNFCGRRPKSEGGDEPLHDFLSSQDHRFKFTVVDLPNVIF